MLAALESSSVWAGLPKRVDNQLNRCVQAAILCVDSRKGELLAVTGGRSAQDGLDRWQSRVMPGDLFTPIVNLCAVDQRRTVIRSNPEVTCLTEEILTLSPSLPMRYRALTACERGTENLPVYKSEERGSSPL